MPASNRRRFLSTGLAALGTVALPDMRRGHVGQLAMAPQGTNQALYAADTRRMASLDEQLVRVEAEQRRFSALIAQKRKAEQLRDSLITELTVIRNIDGERYVWAHILEEVTRALPDYTWLVSIDPLASNGGGQADGATPGDSAPPRRVVRVQIDGRTSDIQAYTRFLRQLANSPWVSNVVAGATNTAVEQDRPVTAFSLTAAFRTADSAYIRTVPITESLHHGIESFLFIFMIGPVREHGRDELMHVAAARLQLQGFVLLV